MPNFIDALERRKCPRDVAKCRIQQHSRYLVLRLYLVLSIFLSVMNMVFDKSSVASQAAIVTNAPDLFMCVISTLCAWAIIDVVINDFAPEKYVFKFAYNYRHITYMMLALTSFSISVSIFDAFGPSVIIGQYWLDGIFATVVAMLDVFSRNRGLK